MDYEHFLKQVAEDLRYSIPGATVEMSDTHPVAAYGHRKAFVLVALKAF